MDERIAKKCGIDIINYFEETGLTPAEAATVLQILLDSIVETAGLVRADKEKEGNTGGASDEAM